MASIILKIEQLYLLVMHLNGSKLETKTLEDKSCTLTLAVKTAWFSQINVGGEKYINRSTGHQLFLINEITH